MRILDVDTVRNFEFWVWYNSNIWICFCAENLIWYPANIWNWIQCETLTQNKANFWVWYISNILLCNSVNICIWYSANVEFDSMVSSARSWQVTSGWQSLRGLLPLIFVGSHLRPAVIRTRPGDVLNNPMCWRNLVQGAILYSKICSGTNPICFLPSTQ